MSQFNPSNEKEILLQHGSQRASVATLGASLRRYFNLDEGGTERDIVWGYSGAAQKKGGQGDVLIPFPGRVAKGHYLFKGLGHQLRLNDKDGPNAIHGFVRNQLWQLIEQTESRAVFRFRLEQSEYAGLGYPFTLEIQVTYALNEQGLSCECSIRNEGKSRAPVGAGFHPYFTVGTATVDDAEVKIPAGRLVEFGPDLLPTGKIVSVEGTAWDYRESRLIKDAHFNHCYTEFTRDALEIARITLRNPQTRSNVTVWMDRMYSYLVVYTGDAIPAPHARKALAIEPMSCATDAFNHPEWGLAILAPGETWLGRFGIIGDFT